MLNCQSSLASIISLMAPRHFLLLIFVCLLGAESECLRTVTLKNECNATIWPGLIEILSDRGNLFDPRRPPPGNDQEQFKTKGFELKPGESVNITAPEGWEGVIWGRSGCSFNTFGNNAPCATGDCGGKLQCGDTIDPTAPFTEASMLLNSSGDYYMVTLLNGFNMPMSISPYGYKKSSQCQVAGCQGNINKICPNERQVRFGGEIVGCKGDCQALEQVDYCCIGPVNIYTNETCKASSYAAAFNHACPRATINGFDFKQSLFQCKGANYIVSFC